MEGTLDLEIGANFNINNGTETHLIFVKLLENTF